MLSRRRWAVVGLVSLVLAGAAPSGLAQTPPRLSARIEAIETPASLDSGEVATAILELRNTGTEPWSADGPVRLSYHWAGPDGRPIVRDGRRTLLPSTIGAGASVRVCALVEAPRETGELRLEWDLVKEGETWFSGVDASSLFAQSVHVRAAAAPRSADARLRLFVWLVVSFVHLLVSAWWAWRTPPGSSASIDARLFDTALFAMGTLHGVLFVASATTGLGAMRGVWWVAGWNALVVSALGAASLRARRSPDVRLRDVPADSVQLHANPDSRVHRALQAAGALALLTLAISWLRVSAQSLLVTGSDAAHYHAPHAVNFALGASPFDLIATPHRYPMGTSLLGAWFMLPTGDPLLIDVVMLAAFALLATALMRAFRSVSSLPGLAWIPWFLLALMAAPLVRNASLFAADLPFAAAFAAAAAQLLANRASARLSWRDAALTGLAFGLLCGVKTTGAAAMGLLVAVATIAWLVRRLAIAPANRGAWLPRPGVARVAGLGAVALTAWLAGGGLWLVRNEVRFGSPVAPSGVRILGVTIFSGETLEESSKYLSVAADMKASGRYPLASRTAHYVRRWLGPVAWPVAGLIVLLVVDYVVSRRRSPDGNAPPSDPRVAMLAGFGAISLTLLWLLVHAPWTSLEWTEGLSLRYALPLIVGIGFCAFVGLFPRTWRWYEHGPLAAVGALLVAGTGTALFLRSRAAIPASSIDPLPGLDTTSLAAAILALAVLWLASRRRATALAAAAGAALGMWPLATWLAARDAALVMEARREEARVVRCAAAQIDGGLDRHHALYAAMLAGEARRGVICSTRRAFLSARFDAPLSLQSMPYTTLVFDTRGVEADTATLDDIGRSSCDYVIVSRAELETERGSALLKRVEQARSWTPAGEAGGYVAFAPAARDAS